MAGDLIEAICPKCGEPMLRRRRRTDGAEFWGCSRSPACRGMRELGAPETIEPETLEPRTLEPEPVLRASVPGGSARAEFDRRAARDREVIRRARPFILAFAGTGAIFGLVMAAVGPMPAGPLGPTIRLFWLFVPLAAVGAALTALLLPATTVAWRTGAIGEERTGELLGPLEAQGFRVIHDRLIPGRRENIDHVVVGPSGVFTIETKNYEGKLRVRHGEVWIAGRRKTEILSQARRQAAAVMAIVSPSPVTPLICIHRADLGWFKVEVDGVRIVTPHEMINVLRKAPARLTPDEVARIADQIDTLRSTVP